jgi:hypothetical protein
MNRCRNKIKINQLIQLFINALQLNIKNEICLEYKKCLVNKQAELAFLKNKV